MVCKSRGILLFPVVLGLIFLGLFFAVTDPNSWPSRNTILAATDMNILPQMSTIWCESVVLSSKHTFIAYKVKNKPKIASELTKNALDVEEKLGRRKHQHLEMKYFMLPGSVLSVFACASNSNAFLRIYQGDLSEDCACAVRQSVESSQSDSDEGEDVSEERQIPTSCLNPLKVAKIPVSDYFECEEFIPLSVNITEPDYFVILFTNDNPAVNRVKIRLSLDRTYYSINRTDDPVYKCGDGSTCVIPLTFASKERVVVLIPSEPDAGKNFFEVQSRCYPRIAVFAILTFALPNVLFAALAYLFYKTPMLGNKTRSSTEWIARNNSSPLLTRRDGQVRGVSVDQINGMSADRELPSYEGLYGEPPPPYSSLRCEQVCATNNDPFRT